MNGIFNKWRIFFLSLRRSCFFYGIPWINIDSRQAMLFDLANRKFYIFGMIFFAARLYLSDRRVADGGLWPVCLDHHRRAAVVRLFLSANRLHRNLFCG